MTLRAHINGNWEVFMRSLIAVLVAVLSSGVTLLAAGLWLGEVKAHIVSDEIHMGLKQKEAVVQRVVDREVAPILQRIEERLSRIERKLDDK